MKEKTMLGYCGVDCAKCDGYIATQSDNISHLKIIARQLSLDFNREIKIDDITCDGCKSNKRICFYCGDDCTIKKCAITKEHLTCAECTTFPCSQLETVFEKKPAAKKNLQDII